MAARLPAFATVLATGPVAIGSASVAVNATAPAGCDVPNNMRKDCGHMGTNQAQCESSGCCWVPTLGDSAEEGGVPWCFFHDGPTPPPTPAPPAPPPPAHCAVQDVDKMDCSKGSKASCESVGCCWHPVASQPDGDTNLTSGGTPWCYYNSLHPNPCANSANWNADSPGFTDAFFALMKTNFEHNLNVDGVGAVVASRDHNTPGGSYFYHWMRDGALSMKGFMEINNNDYDAVAEKMRSYVNWVTKVQGDSDPHDQSVLVEPKFMIPDGSVYPGGWCRPQTDGPGLRATTMAIWGTILGKKGMADEVRNKVWPLIEKDMAWVVQNWEKTGCDLWEEVRSDNFFWERMAFVSALTQAADLALQVGKHMVVPSYHAAAAKIKTSLDAHWNGNYLWESKNRPIDGAVIHAIATFGASNSKFPVTSKEAAKTIQFERKAFCREYKINQDDDTAKIPGVLIGRYPGDSYAGGNPWQLLTAVLAEAFYLASKGFAAHLRGEADTAVTAADVSAWTELLGVTSASELPSAAFKAGDAVMYRMWQYVKDDGGRIDEQMSKTTGAQKSAKGLTWSYANVLHALHVRKGAQPTTIVV